MLYLVTTSNSLKKQLRNMKLTQQQKITYIVIAVVVGFYIARSAFNSSMQMAY